MTPAQQWLHEQYTRLAPEIDAERERQITGEGFTAEQDAGKGPQLRAAAYCYQDQALALHRGRRMLLSLADFLDGGKWWPWGADFWKPSLDIDRNLIKAGALMKAALAAEAL